MHPWAGGTEAVVPLRAGERLSWRLGPRKTVHEPSRNRPNLRTCPRLRQGHSWRAASAATCPSPSTSKPAGFTPGTDAGLEIAATLIEMDPDGTLRRGATHNFHVKPFEGSRIDPVSLAASRAGPPAAAGDTERDALQRVFREIRHAVRAYDCRRAILVGRDGTF